MNFRTPQYNRISNLQDSINETKKEWRRLDSQVSSTTSVLHRVRQNNIRKKDQSRTLKSSNKIIKGIKNMDTGFNEKQLQKDQQQKKRTSDRTSSSSGSTLVDKDYALNENTTPPNQTYRSPILKQRVKVQNERF
jgi:paraquat-inducible protein B